MKSTPALLSLKGHGTKHTTVKMVYYSVVMVSLLTTENNRRVSVVWSVFTLSRGIQMTKAMAAMLVSLTKQVD